MENPKDLTAQLTVNTAKPSGTFATLRPPAAHDATTLTAAGAARALKRKGEDTARDIIKTNIDTNS